MSVANAISGVWEGQAKVNHELFQRWHNGARQMQEGLDGHLHSHPAGGDQLPVGQQQIKSSFSRERQRSEPQELPVQSFDARPPRHGSALSNVSEELRDTADLRDDFSWAMGHPRVASASPASSESGRTARPDLASCRILAVRSMMLSADQATESAIIAGLGGGTR